MHFPRSLSTLASALLFLIAVLGPCHANSNRNSHCISSQKADTLLNQFVSLLEKISVPLAEQILTPDFTQKSVSLNYIFGLPFNATTSPNRTSFIQSQQFQQASGGAMNETFIVLDKIHDCTRIWFHWTDLRTPLPFTGFDEMFLRFENDRWQISQDLSEFNSEAVLVDSGAFPCKATS